MGRKAGGKNFGNFIDEPPKVIEVSDSEVKVLPEIFTSMGKDFITIRDFMETSGLSYDTCARIIREIKSVSDVFKVSGCVHRTDYYIYLSRRFVIQQVASST